MGHWKAECPQRGSTTEGSYTPSLPAVKLQPPIYVQANADDPLTDGLPLEFLQLPMNELSIDEPGDELVFMSSVLSDSPKDRLKESLGKWTQGYNRSWKPPQFSLHARSEDSPHQ